MDFFVVLLLLGIVWGLFSVIAWWVKLPTETTKPVKPVTDADEDADDPNWEDHIRHDPYHPAGSGSGSGGFGYFQHPGGDNVFDSGDEDEQHR